MLLVAWADLMQRFPEWRLSIVGTDTGYGAAGGHLEQLKAMSAELGLGRVTFDPPSYGDAKWAAYRSAESLRASDQIRQFRMAVAEALAAGTPAVVSKGAPSSGLEVHGAGWLVDIDSVALARRPGVGDERVPRGACAARREWPNVDVGGVRLAGDRQQMASTYDWLLRGGAAPTWVTDSLSS